MKRAQVITEITTRGAVLVREGGSHTIYRNPWTKKNLPVPRHKEVSEGVAQRLIRDSEAR